MIGSITHLTAQQKWTPGSKEQVEYNILSQGCNDIMWQFTLMNATKSSALPVAIFQYLKGVGTPTALLVLKHQVQAGRVPASYLNNV